MTRPTRQTRATLTFTISTARRRPCPRRRCQHPNPTAGARFGAAVALTSARAIIGSPGDDAVASDAGAAFVYTLPIVAPAVPALTLNAPSLEAFHTLARRRGLRHAPRGRGPITTGLAYVYDLASTTPATPLAILPNPRPGVPGWIRRRGGDLRHARHRRRIGGRSARQRSRTRLRLRSGERDTRGAGDDVASIRARRIMTISVIRSRFPGRAS